MRIENRTEDVSSLMMNQTVCVHALSTSRHVAVKRTANVILMKKRDKSVLPKPSTKYGHMSLEQNKPQSTTGLRLKHEACRGPYQNLSEK
jgi:hypothetical protein